MSTPQIDAIINGILDREGGEYTDDPNDSGGPTKWGITVPVLMKYLHRPLTLDELRNLSRGTAAHLYVQQFYFEPHFDRIADVSTPIAAELTDTGVNLGPVQATMFLQRCLNAFNRQGKLYPDVKVDGGCGDVTITTLQKYLATRGADAEKVMMRALNGLQAAFYIKLAEGRPKDENFVYGWILNRVS
jgi:lysozyme family protein